MSEAIVQILRDTDYGVQTHIGDLVARRRAGERIGRFVRRQMREPFVQVYPGEDPMRIKDAIYEAKTLAGRDSLEGRRGQFHEPARNLRRAIDTRLLNRFGRPLIQDVVAINIRPNAHFPIQ